MSIDRELDYKDMCEYWLSIRRQLMELEEQEAKIKQELIKLADGERMCYGVKIKRVSLKGNVDWTAIPEVQRLPEEYVEGFRKTGISYFKVTPY